MFQPMAIYVMVAYGLSLALYLRVLYSDQKIIGRAATVMLAAGLGLHYFFLLERARMLHAVPYQDLYGAVSLFAWLLALTYFGLERVHRQRTLGAFLLPFVILIFVAGLLGRPAPPSEPAPGHGLVFALHVTLSVLAYAAFGLSFVMSLMYLAEETLLRKHKLGTIVWRFPALELLERMTRSSVIVGIAAIVAGTLLGFVAVRRLETPVSDFDPKYLVTFVIMGLYAAYLYLERQTSWRGGRASKLCVFNFALILLSVTVVNLFLTRSHRYF